MPQVFSMNELKPLMYTLMMQTGGVIRLQTTDTGNLFS